MKKIIVLLFVLLMSFCIVNFAVAAQAVDWNAIMEGGTAAETALQIQAADTGAVVDLGDILNQSILWIVRGLLAALISFIGYILQKYVVPWVKEKRLFTLAQKLVEAAEAELGRFTGALKWEQVAEWLSLKGLSIDVIDVRQAVKAAWLQLNNTMIVLGLKGTVVPGKLETPAGGPEAGETAEGDVFARTDEPVQVE